MFCGSTMVECHLFKYIEREESQDLLTKSLTCVRSISESMPFHHTCFLHMLTLRLSIRPLSCGVELRLDIGDMCASPRDRGQLRSCSFGFCDFAMDVYIYVPPSLSWAHKSRLRSLTSPIFSLCPRQLSQCNSLMNWRSLLFSSSRLRWYHTLMVRLALARSQDSELMH